MRRRARQILGVEDTAVDAFLRQHATRWVDRLALPLFVGGLASIAVAIVLGPWGHLGASDWITLGSIFVTGAGLFLKLPGRS